MEFVIFGISRSNFFGFNFFFFFFRIVANQIKTKVHGTADDNVHLAHSMHISKTLIENGIMFKQMVRIINTLTNIVVEEEVK